MTPRRLGGQVAPRVAGDEPDRPALRRPAGAAGDARRADGAARAASITWLAAVVAAPAPIAVELAWLACAPVPTAVLLAPLATAWKPPA
jgi:hypothetical protein